MENVQVSELASYYSALLKAQGAEVPGSVNSNVAAEALVELIIDNADEVLKEEFATDVEGMFNVLLGVISLLPENRRTHWTNKLLASMIGEQESAAKLRLRIITSVVNQAPTPSSRIDAAKYLIKYASSTHQLKLIQNMLNNVEKVMGLTHVSVAEKRDLYAVIANVYDNEKSQQHDAIKFLEKYLTCFDSKASPAELAQSVDLASKSVVLCIKEAVYCFKNGIDVSQYTAVSQLAKNAEHKDLHALLMVMNSKTVAEYVSFAKSNNALFAKYGLKEDDCLYNVRVLTLSSFTVSSTENGEVTYDQVEKSLGIKSEEVEEWVVEAISNGLINAKLDQLRNTVVVTSQINQRSGEAEDWKSLAEKLSLWKNNIGGLLETIESRRN